MKKFLHQLFGSHNPSSGGMLTTPVQKTKTLREDVQKLPVHLEMSQVKVGCAQSIGKERDHNEDALFILTTNLSNEKNNTLFGLYIVADGMGGHKNGGIASDLAARTIGNQILKQLASSFINPVPTTPDDSIQEILRVSINESHRMIMKYAPGGGTTVTALLILDKQATLAHVGDSRAYHVTPGGTITPLTRDHSLVMRMIELGQLTAEEALLHPQRNVLYRALGQGEPFTPDISTFPLPESGSILLCSDGLWSVVPEKEIVQIIASAPGPQIACQLLVDAANVHGGPDNITSVLISMPE